METVGRSGGGHNDGRTLTIPSPYRLEQIRLLRFGRQTGRWTTTLHVDDHQRQLSHDRQANGFLFQSDAGSRSSRQANLSGKTGAYGCTYSCNFIFSLKRFDTKTLVTRQLVQDVRSGCYWVRAVKKWTTGYLRGSDKPDRGRFVAGDLAILTRLNLRSLNGVMRCENFCCIREVVTGFQCDLVGLGQLRTLGKFGVDPIERVLQRPVIKPVQHTQRKKVLRTVHLLARQLHVAFQRVHVQRRDWQLMNSIAGQ